MVKGLMKGLLWLTVGVLGVIKGTRYLSDRVYPGTTLPETVKQRLKEEHFRRFGYVCPRCRRRYASPEDFHVDHIIPLARGGRNSLNNAQVICRNCNWEKGDRLNLRDWIWGLT